MPFWCSHEFCNERYAYKTSIGMCTRRVQFIKCSRQGMEKADSRFIHSQAVSRGALLVPEPFTQLDAFDSSCSTFSTGDDSGETVTNNNLPDQYIQDFNPEHTAVNVDQLDSQKTNSFQPFPLPLNALSVSDKIYDGYLRKFRRELSIGR